MLLLIRINSADSTGQININKKSVKNCTENHMKIVQSTWVRFHHFDLARELNRRGYLEHIFTSLPWWKANKEAHEQNIPIDKISCNFIFQGIRRLCSQFPGYNRKLDYQLAVQQTKTYSNWVAKNLPECNSYIGISGSGLHAGKLAKGRGAGYIMDRGSTHIRYANKILQEEHMRWGLNWESINPWLLENEEAETFEANLITVPSEFVKKTFIQENVNPSKIRVVPYGVSLNEFYPVASPPKNCFRVVFVGQFSLRKGAPYLLQAFKDFKHPQKELIVVGSVSPDLLPLIKKYKCEEIKFIGPVPRSEVKKYLSSAHALILPSIEEGLALVQAQALACGCPIIATPNTGSENLIENGKEGLIVEPRSSKSISEAFSLLVDNPILNDSMRIASIERAKRLAGWEKYTTELIEVAKEAERLALKVNNNEK